jgi:hypothetical protein
MNHAFSASNLWNPVKVEIFTVSLATITNYRIYSFGTPA